MEITGHIEVSSNGHCSIYTDAMIGNTALFGYGDSISEILFNVQSRTYRMGVLSTESWKEDCR